MLSPPVCCAGPAPPVAREATGGQYWQDQTRVFLPGPELPPLL